MTDSSQATNTKTASTPARDVLLQQANDPQTLKSRGLLGKRFHKDAFGRIGKPMNPVGKERGQ